MSTIKDVVKEHVERQNHISKSWTEALESAKQKVISENKPKREELNKRLTQLREEELLLSTKWSDSERQLQQELAKTTSQISTFDSKTGSSVSTSAKDKEIEIDKRITELRNEQFSQIWTQTFQEITFIIDKHKDRVKRMDEFLRNKLNEEKNALRFGDQSSELTALRLQEKSLLDQILKKSEEYMIQTEKLRKEIDIKSKELSDLDRLESEKMQKIDEKSIKSERMDRKEEMDKFVAKVKAMTKKT